MSNTNYIYKCIAILAIHGTLFLGGCGSLQPTRLEKRLSQMAQKPNDTKDNYGLIISPTTEERHNENLRMAYNVFLENSFKTNNIFIFTNKIGEKNNFYPLIAGSSKKEINKMFIYLKKVVDTNDFLFIYVTSHGNRVKKKRFFRENISFSVLPLENKLLTENEMAEHLNDIKPKIGFLLFDQCNGMGFAKRTGTNNYIGISACGAESPSLGNFFPTTFFGAFKDPEADKNKDGKLSVLEAFNYTKSKHTVPKIINTGGGPKIFFDKVKPENVKLTEYIQPSKPKPRGDNIFKHIVKKIKSLFN